jgi:NADH dehydrogenase/NADH:ubiquinone oxidoreductase subunit G
MIEDADTILLVGVNPRTEAPVLNSRILKAYNNKNTKVYSIGTPADLTYPYQHLGSNAAILNEIANGSHPVC